MNYLDFILAAQKIGEPRGIVSVCSAHPWVLKAAMRQMAGGYLLVEATCNQVNQFGGYTGMTPTGFVSYVQGIAAENELPLTKLILGGDHLGPNVWQNETAKGAMQKSLDMVRAYAQAGFTKIHLDASMKLADDVPGALAPEISAQRAAQMAKAAEDAAPDASQLRYIIGTEVPVPGGAHAHEESVSVTKAEDARQTIAVTREAFLKAGLSSAWERVMGVVVQPGVEFGDDFVLEYKPEAARELSAFIESEPHLIYEAHSTDYQIRDALRNLVRDHFAILKVGPALTFAFREAVFALANIEKEMFSAEVCSNVPQTLNEAAMRRPEYWKKYYHGNSEEQAFKRKYSLSDRIRYYWTDAEVQSALAHLLRNFGVRPIPLTLISQYLPNQYNPIRAGELRNSADSILLARVQNVLADYQFACAG
jgi:D-tagatose-1,6-bisphosphate aldolase subunit GatZ/KbaZ